MKYSTSGTFKKFSESGNPNPLLEEWIGKVIERTKDAFDSEMLSLGVTMENAKDFKVETTNYVGRGTAYSVYRNGYLVSQFFVDYLGYRKIFPGKNSQS